ncbi:mucin-5AC-like isoform X2 [Engraulis encrasicolus]|uniref:mucin-5AC-like isoform X2 n=1 Tax=Engraulis encrasicolus TaxID=184585 RepID=UPI002FD72E75
MKKMKPKHTPKKIGKREEDEPHISHRHDRYSQSSWSAGIRRDPPMSMNLAQAVQALSSHVTPRWNPKAMASQPKSTKPVQRRQNVPLQKNCFRPASTPRITEDPPRQPARGQIPLRPDLAQIKYFMKQDVVCSPVTPTTPRKVTPGPSAGPSTSNMGPHGRTVGPSSTNAESPSVAHSVRSLQLCSSSSSDSSPSPPSDTLPYRRIVTTSRTRHYRNQLERYKTLRGEKRLQYHKIRLQQLCQTSRDSAGEEPPAEGAQADGPSGNQQGCPEEVSATCRTVKRKWRQCSDRALTKDSGVLCKTPSCRSWSRKLESNSTSSSESSSPAPLMVTPGPTIVPGPTTITTTATAMATTTAATATAVPDPLQTSATPGSLGASHNFDIDLFLGDTGSPRSKAVRRKGTHGEGGGQTPGISSSHARPNEVKARNAQGDVSDSPSSAKTTPRKHVHFQDQSRSPGTPSSMKSACVGDFGEALTSGTPYKPVQNKRVQSPANKAKGSVVKTERNHVNSPLVKALLPSTPCTSSIGGTKLASNVEAPAWNIVVKPKSSCSSTSSGSNQLEIDTKRPQGAGAKQHNAIKRTARTEPKPKSAKAKQNPLPDTPRPKMVKSSALIPRSRVPPLQVCESPSTPRSVSSSSHPEKTQTPAKKKEKEKTCLPSALKNTSTEGSGSAKKPRVKQPKSSSANNPSKGGRGKSKASGESALECGVMQAAASDERKSNVEQTHLAANGDESQATGGVSTSSAQQGGSSSSSSPSPRVGHAPEKKRRKKEEPWSKKKYLLEKLATAEAMSAEQSPSQAPGTGSAAQLVTQEITSEAELPPLHADDGTSTAPSGDTTACQIQIVSRPEPSPSTLSETEAVSSTSSILNHQAAKPGESCGASNGNVKSCDTGELTKGSETEPKSCNSSSPQRPHPPSVTHSTTTNSSWSSSSPQSKMSDPPNAMVAELDGEVKEPEYCQPSTSAPPQSSTSSAGTLVRTSEELLNPTEQPLNGAAGGGPGSSCDAMARGTDKRVPIAILLKTMRDRGDSALPSTSGGSHGAPVELPLTPDPDLGNETAGCSMAFVPGAWRGIEIPDPSSCHARTVLTDTLRNLIVTKTIKGVFSLLGMRTTSPNPIPTPAATSVAPCQQPQQQHQQHAHQQQYLYLQQQHPPYPHPYLHQHPHPQHQYHQYRQPTQQTALLQHPTPTRHASQTQTPLSQIYCYARTPTPRPRLEALLPGSRPPPTQVFSPHLGLLSSTPPPRAPPPPPPLPHRPTERITDERDQTAVIDLTQMPDKEDGNL